MKHAYSMQLFLSLCIVFGLQGCGSSPHKTTTEPSQQTTTTAPNDLLIKQLIIDAENSPSPARERLLLDAIHLLKGSSDHTQINHILASIQPIGLPTETYAEYINLASEIYMEQENYTAATALLEHEETISLLSYSPPHLVQAINIKRAQLFAYHGDYPQSVALRITLAQNITTPELTEDNYTALWQSLMYIPPDQLSLKATTTFDDAQGWYILAALTKNYSDIDQQLAALNKWIKNWPNHPAQSRLPERLVLLQKLALNRPKNIVIFLPLSGKLEHAGNSILEGIFAAFYQSLSIGSFVPKITVIDTSEIQSTDFLESYTKNIAIHKADLVIGPLEKEKVSLLAQQLILPVTTLALNYIETEVNTPSLYQFGLAVEDEISSLANRANIAGYQQALILSPETTWGNRVALSLHDKWIENKGKVIAMDSFKGNNDYSKIIQSALNVTDSKNRAKQLKNFIKEKVEFSPRRRQDIDVIFLAANAKQARQIKPTLAFHYGGDIPILTTSRVFSGKPLPDIDRDLNGIVFTDIPWIYEHSAIRTDIDNSQRISPPYQRLVALGIDTFRLYPRLIQLESIPNTKLYGKTGNLRLKEGRIIEREQVWGVFHNGIPKHIPSLTKNIMEPQS